ncbi:NAD(P)/FAD-dependent oxidoreductase [Desulfoluna spongiiphila]|uniref:NAD(P)/FAD-dependent oxidoreductase n=1 Tax=Desulfoluna spongiiphila TaxID=419481 RepID=UPI00125399AF|nr:NAD(P)/FAD-dependent oxidoreductase [Desulfoluna spongiiphila]VVS95557.1 opine oxidase subunit a/hydrogen cyanide synthase subunit b [Desulfoluna spongiiphila]
MNHHCDVVVIGAGPAGLAASATLAEMGLDVLTLDEQHRVGGQIYRHVEVAPKAAHTLFGPDYSRGLDLVNEFRKSGARHEPGASVWQVEPDGTVCYSQAGASRRIRANYIVAATGAMERPMPIPGWTLPGVMGAGAANNLAKEAGLTPSGRVVLAGSGPLLLLEASLLIKKGVNIAAILETTPTIPSVWALPRAPQALLRSDFLLKGALMMREIKRSGVSHYKGVTGIRALGEEAVESVEAVCGDKTLHLKADMLLLHFGVIPNTHIFRQMGCRMAWNPRQRYWTPACDPWGRTNFERVFAAGDGAGVSGALAARYKGELAALEIARCLGILSEEERNTHALPLRKAKMHDAWPRPFIDALYAPQPGQFLFTDDTVLCRCENVTVGEVRKVVGEGVRDVNEVKIITRCGMGPCQGRMCGPALAEVVGSALKISPHRTGQLSVRPPLKPIPLEEIAAMDLSAGTDGGNWLLDKK